MAGARAWLAAGVALGVTGTWIGTADEPWQAAAMVVAVLHGGYLVFQLFGALLAQLDRRWLVVHLTSLTWGVAVVAMGLRCPLTRLEKGLHARSGEAPYSGSFLDHYVYGTLLPDGSQAWGFGLFVLLTVGVYAWLARRLRPAAAGLVAP